MNDRRRYAIAWTCSLLMHVAAVPILSNGLAVRGFGPLPETTADALVQFEPLPAKPEPPFANRLIDTPVASSEPTHDTELISDKNAKAADAVDTEGDANAPHVDRIDDFEQLARSPSEASMPASPAIEPTESPDESGETKQGETDSPKGDGAKASAPEPLQVAMLEQQPRTPIVSAEIEQAAQPAASTPPPVPQPSEEAQASASRLEGGVGNSGFLSFEAMRHELAPYLKDVQSRVEKRWRIMLELKYKNARPTKAVVDCTIGPDGKLVSVTIVNAGDSVAYGPLCKQAIESAAPFPPFPFDVPDVYRDKNLEIRWTFNFL